MSRELRPKELVVDERSRMARLIGGLKGEEFEDARDLCESLRNRFMPGSANDRAPLANAAFGGIGGRLIGLSSVCLLCGCGATGLFPLGVAP